MLGSLTSTKESYTYSYMVGVMIAELTLSSRNILFLKLTFERSHVRAQVLARLTMHGGFLFLRPWWLLVAQLGGGT